MASFGFKVALRGNLDGFLRDLERSVPQARTRAVRSIGLRVRNFIRREVKKGRLGPGIEKAIRQVNEPRRGDSISPRAIVLSKALVNRPSGKVDIVTVFEEGAVIRPVTAKALYSRRTQAKGGLRYLGQEVRIKRRLHLAAGINRLLALVPEQEAKELDKSAVRAARKASA